MILRREVFSSYYYYYYFLLLFLLLNTISGPDVAVLRSVSEDDLTNVVQLSPLGKQDHQRAVFYRTAASNLHYFCKLDPDPH